jgi:archaellum component FlaC
MNLKNASELITKQELSISQLKITSDNSLKIAGTCEQGLERLKQEFKDDLKTS